MDPTLFAAAMNSLPSPAVVIRNGRIVGQKGDIARTGYVWSVSKSLVALVFARALQQGQVANYDVAVPNSNVPGDPPATFRQFMSMTSDFNLTPHSPGNHYAYNNGAVHFYGTYLKNTFYPAGPKCRCCRKRMFPRSDFKTVFLTTGRLLLRLGWRLGNVDPRPGSHWLSAFA